MVQSVPKHSLIPRPTAPPGAEGLGTRLAKASHLLQLCVCVCVGGGGGGGTLGQGMVNPHASG